ncbi:MAG: glycosyl transferase [Patescibacteria group bacterium]|nr:MAG: glycosyl transferase [Patescibacteria group bacterium]
MRDSIQIIIVSHNHGGFLYNCLDSLHRNTSLKIKIVVIINNPKDDISYEIIKKFLNKFYEIKILKNKKPQGLAKNLNQGIKLFNEDFILILNPDTILTKNAIDNLYKFAKNMPKAAICGPKILNPDESIQYSARRFPNFKTFLIRRLPWRKFFINSKINLHHLGYDLDLNKSQRVDWLLGACWLVKRKAIEDIGLFDERYYLYVEDIDYCYRVWKKGWECWYVPQSTIIHYHQAESDKRFFTIYNLYHIKSMFYYFLKNNLKIIK